MLRARRTAATLTILLILALSPSGSALARSTPSTATPSGGPAAHPPNDTRELHTRGRVDVDRVARTLADDEGAPDGGADIAGDPATQNGTAAPSLSKLPLLTTGDDPSVAAGPDHVIRADSSRFVISTRAGGGTQIIATADLFLLPEGWDGSYAKIWFDSRQQRWVAVESSQGCATAEGALDIAISDTADPTAGWRVYFFPYQDARILDPRFGNSTDKFVLTSHVEPMAVGCADAAGDEYWDVTILDIPQALAGTEEDAAYHQFDLEPDADVVRQFLPIAQQPPTSATAFLVAHEFVAGPNEIRPFLYRITGTGPSATPQPGIDLTTIGLDDHAPPPPVPALDDPVSEFPTSGAWRAERLAFTQAAACTPTGDDTERACVRVVELRTATATPTLRQDLLLGATGSDTFHGSLAYSLSGELIVSYGRAAAPSGPVDSAVVRQAPSDAVGTVSAPVSLEAGAGDFASDATQISIGSAPDPLVADAVWTTNLASVSGGHEIRAAQARTFGGATFKTVAPTRILDTRTDTGLANPFQSNVARSFQVAGANGIPSGAIAITANVTVTGQTGAGYVSVTPTATNTPTSSTLNFPVGDVRANNATVPLAADGRLAAVYKAASNRTAELVIDVTGYFLPDDAGSTYEPIDPVRLLDTRSGDGLSGPFQANVPRTVQITTRGDIPSGAVAITGNLTVTGQTRGGYVSVTPLADATPTTSTINFPAGDTRANGLTIPLSPNGRVSAVYKASSGSTHLILDVTGYYVAGTSGLRFFPLQPGRILYSRATTLTLLTGKFSSSSARTLPVGGHFGVPSDAQAATGNLTVTGQTRAGYVSITRTKTNSPTVSTINFPSGDTRPNGVTVPLDANDDIHLVYKASAGSTTHLVLDVTGYFR